MDVKFSKKLKGRAADAAIHAKAALFGEKTQRALKSAAPALVSGALAFIFASGELLNGVYPFGIALIAAVSSPTAAAGAAAGAMLGAVATKNAIVYISMYAALFLVRLLIGLYRNSSGSRITDKAPVADLPGEIARKISSGALIKERMFTENVFVKMSLALVFMFACGMLSLEYANLYRTVFSVLFASAVCPLFTLAYTGLADDKARLTSLRYAGAAAVNFTIVFALKNVELFGIGLSVVFAVCAAFYVSYTAGCEKAAFIALLGGMALEPALAPMYAVAAIVSALLWKAGPLPAVFIASAMSMSWAAYVSGFASFSSVMPEIITASVLSALLIRFGFIRRESPLLLMPGRAFDASDVRLELAEMKQTHSKTRLSSLSDAMKSLAGLFSNLAERLRRPEMTHLRSIAADALDSKCVGCNMKKQCREKDFHEDELIEKLTVCLNERGRVSADAIPEHILRRCYNMDGIIDEINDKMTADTRLFAEGDNTRYAAIDYEAMAALLSAAAKEQEEEFTLDHSASRLLWDEFRKNELYAEAVAVYGTRQKKIYVRRLDLARLALGGDDIRQLAEKALGSSLTQPAFSIDGDDVSFTMTSCPRYKIKSALATAAGGAGEANGDIITAFEGADDYYYALVSDGMGSGTDAAITSRVCAVFLEKMLKAGAGSRSALQLLNNFICERGDECFATIDLMEADLITGVARFIKSGAAPSFIIRGTSLFRLHSKTVPVGIMRALDAEKTTFELQCGDVIIMLSDGVAQSFEDCSWLLDMLCDPALWKMSPERSAKKIVAEAKKQSPRPDDITVGIIVVGRD